MNYIHGIGPCRRGAVRESRKWTAVLPEIPSSRDGDVAADAVLGVDEISQPRVKDEFVLRIESGEALNEQVGILADSRTIPPRHRPAYVDADLHGFTVGASGCSC